MTVKRPRMMFNAIYCENGHYVEPAEDVSERRSPWFDGLEIREMEWGTGPAQDGATHTQFCPECGLPTASRCAQCQFPIMCDPRRPSYCRRCGKPFPWTESSLAATAELVMEEERLSEEDKQLLTASLTDLVSETPRTTLAATRVKRIAGKVGGAFKAAMYKFAVDCASETAKKIVLGE
jgi:hypothetical protein